MADLGVGGAFALAVGLAVASPAPPTMPAPVERLRVEVLGVHPHDERAFTQGLLWHAGSLYESLGLYQRSSLRRVEPASGLVLEQVAVAPELFAEGLALVGERLIQLTWQSGLALTYDRASLAALEPMSYDGEGWGLAWDGRRLLMSDGSDRIVFREPATFQVLGGVGVTFEGRPLVHLNELEWVDGALWANVWTDDRLFRIDPESGRVTAVADAGGLLDPDERRRADVLNGIAYDPTSRSFWITGKLWPKMFRVRFVPAEAPPPR